MERRSHEGFRTIPVNITENNHFDIKRMSRMKTDASDSGLGDTLEQWDLESLLTIAFAS